MAFLVGHSIILCTYSFIYLVIYLLTYLFIYLFYLFIYLFISADYFHSKFDYMILCNLIHIIAILSCDCIFADVIYYRGRAVTNVGRTCGPTPLHICIWLQ